MIATSKLILEKYLQQASLKVLNSFNCNLQVDKMSTLLEGAAYTRTCLPYGKIKVQPLTLEKPYITAKRLDLSGSNLVSNTVESDYIIEVTVLQKLKSYSFLLHGTEQGCEVTVNQGSALHQTI